MTLEEKNKEFHSKCDEIESFIDKSIKERHLNYRVMKLHKGSKGSYFRIACQCCDNDHDMTAYMYLSEAGTSMMELSLKMLSCPGWNRDLWILKQWDKLIAILKIIFTGYIEFEKEFYLDTDEHIDSFINALCDGRDRLRSCDKRLK